MHDRARSCLVYLIALLPLIGAAACDSPAVVATPEPELPSLSASALPGAAASASLSAATPAPAPSPSASAYAPDPPGVTCFDHYYGSSVSKDLPRARACFERKVAASPSCGGSSPDLERLYLAAMLIDAQGGPAEPARVSALFADCYADISVQSINEEATKRASLDPSRSPLDFCKDIGGTTITIGQCHTVDAQRFTNERIHVEKLLDARLDADGKRLAALARDAYAAFADKQGQASSDPYRNGSIHSNVWRSRQTEYERKRLEEVAKLFEYSLSSGTDPALAEKELEAPFREVREGDAEHKRLFDVARAAWRKYRDAEIALYVHLFGKKLGEREVKRDVQTVLTRRYQAILEDALKP